MTMPGERETQGRAAGSFPSPFGEVAPHPLAREAAEALQAELRSGLIAPGLPTALLEGADGGKMFGVLVAEGPDGSTRCLRAFSGMLAGRWDVEGFVPPVFDRQARALLEPEGEATVKALHARFEAARTSEERARLVSEDDAQRERHELERAALRSRHDERRRVRHQRRAAIAPSTQLTEAERRDALHALDQESRGDKAERRRLDAAHAQQRDALEPKLARLERRLKALDRLRQHASRTLMRRLHDTYVVPNARGDRRPLRALYPNGEPPSGAGDCAAPKLLAAAFRMGLRPIGLAEFWWGTPPRTGGRVTGSYYPACRDKCGPLLPFMLEGLDVETARPFVPLKHASSGLNVLHEDRWVVVLDKPCGLLSVPGRAESLKDSVLERLRARYPEARGPLLCHRLDLDTSGLLVAALHPDVYAEVQRQFARREVHKRYVAWLDGRVEGSEGTIEFPIRVDLHDRPRQIRDLVHGRRAVTRWQVVSRDGRRTRVALFPLTGRTHQLRVHAAHPLGLNAPIVGDRLYGRPDTRLHLHAEQLAFTHPATGARVCFESAAPF